MMARSLAVALVALAISPPVVAQAPDTAARIAAGKRTFDAVGCSGCHGFSGQGGIGPMAGPRIAHLPTAAITAIIRRPPQPMPPYSRAVLPDAKVAEIGDYLHAQPEPRRLDTVPMIPKPKLTGDRAASGPKGGH